MGCVGQTSSPGTSVVVGTAVSTIGLIGVPVSRLSMYMKQTFPVDPTPLTVRPFTSASKSTGPAAMSLSQMS